MSKVGQNNPALTGGSKQDKGQHFEKKIKSKTAAPEGLTQWGTKKDPKALQEEEEEEVKLLTCDNASPGSHGQALVPGRNNHQLVVSGEGEQANQKPAGKKPPPHALSLQVRTGATEAVELALEKKQWHQAKAAESKALALASWKKHEEFLRLHDAAHAPKEIKHRNTRFTGEVLLGNTLKPSHSDAQSNDATMELGNGHQSHKEGTLHSLVAMTPSPMPAAHFDKAEQAVQDANNTEGGDNGQFSPIMTWGEIEGTPMILDPSSTPMHGWASQGGESHQNFHIKPRQGRDALADNMEKQLLKKKKKQQQQKETQLSRMLGQRGASTSLSSALVGGGATPSLTQAPGSLSTTNRSTRKRRASATPATPLGSLTPAAQLLAARIAKQTGDIGGFGSGSSSSLRQSYNGSIFHSQPTANKATKRNSGIEKKGRSSPRQSKGSGLTDGLLRL